MGEPVIGVNVIAKGTTMGIITDFGGNFMLNAPQNSILSAILVGYEAVEIEAVPLAVATLEDDS